MTPSVPKVSNYVVVTEVFPPAIGGSGRWLWEIYSRFTKGSVTIIAAQTPGKEPLETALDIRRIPFSFPTWSVIRSVSAYFRVVWAVMKEARRCGAREIHVARALPEGWAAYLACLVLKARYTCFVHGEEVAYAQSSRELRWAMGVVYRNAHGIIVNSASTKRILSEAYGDQLPDINVVHPGVDAGWYVPAASSPTRREALGWTERRVLLSVGRLQRRKGHDTVIRALPAIVSAIPDVLYCVVGDGEEEASLRTLAGALGVEPFVQFRGAADDDELLRCYQECQLFVMPNRVVDGDVEGFGIVFLEAQACGVPVVAGATGGPPETLSEPETGRVVSGNDASELAEVIVSLLSRPDELDAMGHRARKWAEGFDWSVKAAEARRALTGEVSL